MDTAVLQSADSLATTDVVLVTRFPSAGYLVVALGLWMVQDLSRHICYLSLCAKICLLLIYKGRKVEPRCMNSSTLEMGCVCGCLWAFDNMITRNA